MGSNALALPNWVHIFIIIIFLQKILRAKYVPAFVCIFSLVARKIRGVNFPNIVYRRKIVCHWRVIIKCVIARRIFERNLPRRCKINGTFVLHRRVDRSWREIRTDVCSERGRVKWRLSTVSKYWDAFHQKSRFTTKNLDLTKKKIDDLICLNWPYDEEFVALF